MGEHKTFFLSKYFISVASVLLLVIFLNYANSLHSPFQYDDEHTVVRNPSIRDNTYFQAPPVRNRHIFYLTFALNYHWGKLNPFGYHLSNILLHFFVSILVFLISLITIEKGVLWSRSAAVKIAFMASLFFALNPAHSETVTYISGRGSSLAALFYLLSLLFFVLGSLKYCKVKFPMQLLYIFSLLSGVIAVFSKEISVTLPLAIILYDACFMRTGNWIKFRSRFLYYYLPFLITAILFIGKLSFEANNYYLWLKKADSAYALMQLKVIAVMTKLFFFPINLTFDYQFPEFFYSKELTFVFAIVFFMIIALSIIKIFNQQLSVLYFSVLWYLITISPTNSILPRLEPFNERNLYLPSFGLCILFASLSYFVFIHNKKHPGRLLLIFSTLMIIFTINSALLINRNSIYRTKILLWEDTLKKSPGKARVINNLSKAYLKAGDYEKAMKGFDQILVSIPSDYFAHVNRGKIFADTGDFEKAKNEFQEAIKIDPSLPEAHYNLGAYYALKGEFVKAESELTEGKRHEYIGVHPDFYLNKATIYVQLNYLPEAEDAVKEFMRLFPDVPKAHFLLGQIYKRSGKKKLAVAEFEKSKTGKNLLVNAHNNIGLIYIEQNKFDEAIREFKKAILANPSFVEARVNMGILFLEIKKDKEKARFYFETALALKPEINKAETIKSLLLKLNKQGGFNS